jgi:hypothetical protein
MIRDDQFIGQLEDYLDAFDGTTPLPGHVRDAIHGALPGVHQVRPLPAPLRRLRSPRAGSLAAGWALIAAALIISIGGGAVLGINRWLGPAASPFVYTEPSPLPGTLLGNADYRSCGRGGPPISCLTAGTYTLGNGLLQRTPATIVIPKGWFEWDPGPGSQGVLLDRPDAKLGTGWGVVLSAVGAVMRDPCDVSKGRFPTAATDSVDGLVAAMTSWPGFEVSAPAAITVGGKPGTLVAVSSRKTVTDCPNGVIWDTPQGTAFDAYPMVAERALGYTAQFRILDVGGEIVAIRTSDFPQPSPFEVSQGIAPDPGRHRAEQQTLRDIVASIRFGQGS